MKHHALMISAFALFLMTSMCQAQTLRRWDFNKIDDREGWHVRTGARGVVMGGSLWLTLTATPKMSARYYEGIGNQIEFDQTEADTNLASSPRGLDIPATEGTQVRMRVLNLSPVTDFFLMWRAKGEDWGTTEGKDMSSLLKPPAQSKHRALQPDLKQWQEITCYIDGKWHRVIDQFAILPSPSAPQYRDDLWIDWIEIGSGPPELVRARPDVVSSGVVPKVTIPEISQAGSADAFKVLDEALIVDVPKDGFTYPFMGPGGRYGPN
ncbi:MAG: hypothetical protein HY508_11170 [Acidobacteria bacterium]|nr:hypothetical protein [Acidobacteriota bacterium]